MSFGSKCPICKIETSIGDYDYFNIISLIIVYLHDALGKVTDGKLKYALVLKSARNDICNN